MVTSNEIILLARAAGYDSVFIDMEHSVLGIENVSRLCSASLLSGITPFVRVPYECGSGFVQRVLDGGAMGIVFPHISTAGMSLLYFICISTWDLSDSRRSTARRVHNKISP